MSSILSLPSFTSSAILREAAVNSSWPLYAIAMFSSYSLLSLVFCSSLIMSCFSFSGSSSVLPKNCTLQS